MAEVKRVIFRCPEEVFQRMAVEAKKQGVDWTSFIVRAISESVDSAEMKRAYPEALSDYAKLVRRVERLEKERKKSEASLS